MNPFVFDYTEEDFDFKEPLPWLPAKVLRPRVPLRVESLNREFGRVKLDTGADVTTLPWKLVEDPAGCPSIRLQPSGTAIRLQPSGTVRHRGKKRDSYTTRVELKLEEDPGTGVLRWSTRVRFVKEFDRILLGHAGFLEYVNVTFFGEGQRAEVLPNRTFPGEVTRPTAIARACQPAAPRGAGNPRSLQFDYEENPLHPGRFLPFVPIRLSGATNSVFVKKAFVDTGSDFCLFPLCYAHQLGVKFLDDGQRTYPWGENERQLRYGTVRLELTERTGSAPPLAWTTGMNFLDVCPDDPCLRFPLLGQFGFLQFMDATFLGARHQLRLVPNASFPAPGLTWTTP